MCILKFCNQYVPIEHTLHSSRAEQMMLNQRRMLARNTKMHLLCSESKCENVFIAWNAVRLSHSWIFFFAFMLQQLSMKCDHVAFTGKRPSFHAPTVCLSLPTANTKDRSLFDCRHDCSLAFTTRQSATWNQNRSLAENAENYVNDEKQSRSKKQKTCERVKN